MRNVSRFFLFALVLSFAAMACKKDDPINPHEITADYYFQVILDGDTMTYQEGINDYGNIIGDFGGGQYGSEWQYAPFTCIAHNEALVNANPTTLANSGALALVVLNTDEVTSLPEYEVLMSTGTYDFGMLSRNAGDTAVAGAFVSMFDENGIEWTSNGPQTNASLTITEYTDFVDNGKTPPTHKIVTAEFNCTLYNAAGSQKTLTGGKARGRIIAYQ